MRSEIESGDMVIRPWPDIDGELAIELANDREFDNIETGWLNRPGVLTLVKALIKNFEIKEGELNDAAK